MQAESSSIWLVRFRAWQRGARPRRWRGFGRRSAERGWVVTFRWLRWRSWSQLGTLCRSSSLRSGWCAKSSLHSADSSSAAVKWSMPSKSECLFAEIHWRAFPAWLSSCLKLEPGSTASSRQMGCRKQLRHPALPAFYFGQTPSLAWSKSFLSGCGSAAVRWIVSSRWSAWLARHFTRRLLNHSKVRL